MTNEKSVNSLNYKKKNKNYMLPIIFLFASIFFAPYRVYRVFSLGSQTITFFRASSILLFISLLFALLARNGKIKIDKTKIILMCILLTMMISAIYSPNLSGGVSNFNSMFFSVIWILVSLIVLEQRPDAMYYSIKMLILSSIVPIGIGLYQWFFYSISGTFPDLPFSSLLSITRTEVTYNIFARATSTFSDPSYYATFLSIINIMSLGLLIEVSSILKRIKLKRTVCLIVYVITLIALFQTLSISGLIGVIVGTSCLFLLKNRIKARVIIYILIIIMFMYMILRLNNNLLETIIFKINNTSMNTGISGRNEYIMNALVKFLENPLFGAGFGGLLIPGASFSSAHNSLLTILGQQGLIPFILNSFILVYYPTRSIIRIRRLNRENASIAVIVYSSYISMIAISMGYDILYKMDNSAVMISLILAVTNVNFINSHSE